ncbi:hypothetical protein [Roseomonas sp. WA12]
MSHLHYTHAPPTDLDVLAARRAELAYRLAVGRGCPKWEAWEQAVADFRACHPNWPVALVEREAARTVGALVLNQRTAAEARVRQSANRIPLDLLVDLTTPETAESMRAATRVEELGAGAVSIFRGAWKMTGNVRPVSAQLPLRRQSRSDVTLHV